MKNKFIIPIGMLCLAMYFILDHYTETSDFILGLFIGLSIGINVVGVFILGRWIGNYSDKSDCE